MNEKPDEPTKQPSETGQPETQEQPEYREVSQEELKQILAAHKKWLESKGKEGKQAFLRKANLQKADLAGANLQKADLAGANLQKANLYKANLKEADLTLADLKGASLRDVEGLSKATLHNSNLEDVVGLLGAEFARADVTGTTLPKDIREFKILEVIEETSKNARKIFLSMLLGCVYAWLTIATTTDANLLTNSASSPLPIIGTKVPIAWFYVAAPLILMLLYVYFHFYLQRLWEGLAGLPAIFPDGKRLDQRAYPWLLLNGLVRRHFDRLQDARTAFGNLEELVTILLAWWVVPATLLVFWLRYLPRHDWWGTAFHIVLLTAAIWGATFLYRIAASALRGESRSSFGNAGTWLMPFVAVGITLLSVSAIENSRAFITTHVSYNTFAELREADVSTKPPDYYKLSEQQKRESVKGANLRGRNLRYADAFKAFLVNADLRDANLQGAILRDAQLQGANLVGAQLQKVFLFRANLREANLDSANLQGANLREVKGVTASQIKQARNWQLAFYSDDFLKELDLPADHNKTVKKKLAEIEKEKEKTVTKP